MDDAADQSAAAAALRAWQRDMAQQGAASGADRPGRGAGPAPVRGQAKQAAAAGAAARDDAARGGAGDQLLGRELAAAEGLDLLFGGPMRLPGDVDCSGRAAPLIREAAGPGTDAAEGGGGEDEAQPELQQVSKHTRELLRKQRALPTAERERLAENARLRGNEAFRAGDVWEAREAYTLALGLNSRDARIFANRAAVFVRLRRWAEALADADAALVINAAHAKALLRRAEALRHLGRRDECMQTLDALERLEPGAKDAAQIRRQLQRQEEEAAAAARPREPAALSPIATHRLRPVSPANGQARADAANGSGGAAAGMYRIPVVESEDTTDDSDADVEMLVPPPLPAAAANGQAGAQNAQQRAAADARSVSLSALAEAAAAAAAGAEAAEARARTAAAEAERLEAAMQEAVEAAVAAEAARSEAAHRAAGAFGGDDEGLQGASFSEAVARLKERGTAAFKQGNVKAAVDLFGRALRLAPDSPQLWCNRALAHLHARRPREAAHDAAAALAHADANGELRAKALLRRSRAKRELGDLYGARDDLLACIRMLPGGREREEVGAECRVLVKLIAERKASAAAASAAAPKASSDYGHTVIEELPSDEEDESAALEELHLKGIADDEAAVNRAARQRANTATNRAEWESPARLAAEVAAASERATAARTAWEAAAQQAASAQAAATAARRAAEESAAAAAAAQEAAPATPPAPVSTSAPAAAAAAAPAPDAASAGGPPSVEALNALGRERFAAGDLAGAVSAWQEVLMEEPDHAFALCNLAQVMRLAGDSAGAERAATEVLQLPAARVTEALRIKATHRRALALEDLGRWEEALALLSEIAHASPCGLDLVRLGEKVQSRRKAPGAAPWEPEAVAEQAAATEPKAEAAAVELAATAEAAAAAEPAARGEAASEPTSVAPAGQQQQLEECSGGRGVAGAAAAVVQPASLVPSEEEEAAVNAASGATVASTAAPQPVETAAPAASRRPILVVPETESEEEGDQPTDEQQLLAGSAAAAGGAAIAAGSEPAAAAADQPAASGAQQRRRPIAVVFDDSSDEEEEAAADEQGAGAASASGGERHDSPGDSAAAGGQQQEVDQQQEEQSDQQASVTTDAGRTHQQAEEEAQEEQHKEQPQDAASAAAGEAFTAQQQQNEQDKPKAKKKKKKSKGQAQPAEAAADGGGADEAAAADAGGGSGASAAGSASAGAGIGNQNKAAGRTPAPTCPEPREPLATLLLPTSPGRAALQLQLPASAVAEARAKRDAARDEWTQLLLSKLGKAGGSKGQSRIGAGAAGPEDGATDGVLGRIQESLRKQRDEADRGAARGEALLRQGKAAEALRALGRGAEAEPEDPRFQALIAQAYMKLKRPDRALAAVDTALALEGVAAAEGSESATRSSRKPQGAAWLGGVLARRAAVLRQLGRVQEALQSAKQAVAADPSEPSHAQLASELTEARRREVAARVVAAQAGRGSAAAPAAAAAAVPQNDSREEGGSADAASASRKTAPPPRKPQKAAGAAQPPEPAPAPAAAPAAAAAAPPAAPEPAGAADARRAGQGASPDANGAACPAAAAAAAPVVWRINPITVEEVSGSEAEDADEDEEEEGEAVTKAEATAAASLEANGTAPVAASAPAAARAAVPAPPRSALELQRALSTLAPRGPGGGEAVPAALVDYVRSIPPRSYPKILKGGLTPELLAPLAAALAASAADGGAEAAEAARDALLGLAGAERFGLVAAMSARGGGAAGAVRRAAAAVEAAGLDAGELRAKYAPLLR
ncbi:hypothetical protein Rsub_00908 [Raphidocelis subcapitata]|uniref:RNA polymerase II-associated protein 3 n=1 Tax=Raphidocelis subcapitata TaxID=307507 RepID=A0A2V0NLB5_9CHLO|nr:hypothetical protein Rsub_00908 [Raphidocelis subcapitata]|eukprot:GBF88196.1 hypothetical protein Rsub_00908 [Raphidocelis subcapitata]